MSVEKVKEFFKRLEDDEAFRDDFLKDETLEKDNYEAICKAAFVKGYEFTLEDFKAAKEEMKDIELTHDQLDKVSGGIPGDLLCAVPPIGGCSSAATYYSTCEHQAWAEINSGCSAPALA
ncbi:MAG: Nif11-like leader peptide family natural product precursor [Deferribacterales bacterium]